MREAAVLTSNSAGPVCHYAQGDVRILIAGATGVLGRATVSHLRRHDVAGLTRSEEKLESLSALGAEPFLCDVYDYDELLRVAQRFRPRIVANFLAALSDWGQQPHSARKEERICSAMPNC